MSEKMLTTCVAPWFGSNRMLAKEVGRELKGCNWVGVVFAGGMSELAEIDARTLNVNDLHSHVINLARVMSDQIHGPKLYRELRRPANSFHPTVLLNAQSICRHQAKHPLPWDCPIEPAHLAWAISYFICAWMPRHGSSGTDGEFSVGMSTRWNANGGDSAKHYWSAVASINAWRRVLRRANFTVLDWKEFLSKCKDADGHGIYCDPPFPGPGDKYAYKMTDDDHRELARRLGTYKATRIVCRYYDVPLIRELYPEPQWTWRHLKGRKQTNEESPEVLITNRR